MKRRALRRTLDGVAGKKKAAPKKAKVQRSSPPLAPAEVLARLVAEESWPDGVAVRPAREVDDLLLVQLRVYIDSLDAAQTRIDFTGHVLDALAEGLYRVTLSRETPAVERARDLREILLALTVAARSKSKRGVGAIRSAARKWEKDAKVVRLPPLFEAAAKIGNEELLLRQLGARITRANGIDAAALSNWLAASLWPRRVVRLDKAASEALERVVSPQAPIILKELLAKKVTRLVGGRPQPVRAFLEEPHSGGSQRDGATKCECARCVADRIVKHAQSALRHLDHKPT